MKLLIVSNKFKLSGIYMMVDKLFFVNGGVISDSDIPTVTPEPLSLQVATVIAFMIIALLLGITLLHYMSLNDKYIKEPAPMEKSDQTLSYAFSDGVRGKYIFLSFSGEPPHMQVRINGTRVNFGGGHLNMISDDGHRVMGIFLDRVYIIKTLDILAQEQKHTKLINVTIKDENSNKTWPQTTTMVVDE